MADEFDIEDDIMNQLGEEFGKDDDTNVDVGGTDDQQAGTSNKEETIAEDIAKQVDTQTNIDNNAAGTKSGTDQQQQQQQQQQQEPRGPQDLVDARGNVIAKGGKERRYYETAQKEKRRADDLQTNFDRQTVELNAYKQAATIGQQLNLSPQEVTSGAQLISSWKADPIGTLKHMLTQAQAAGYNVSEISGTDVSAIKQMIEQEMAPFRQQYQAEQQTSAAQSEATRVYNDFISRYPDANVHTDTIARLLQEDNTLSLEAAYYKLQSFYHARGFDFTKSLGQIEQELQAKNNPANVNQQQQQKQQQQTVPQGVNVDPRNSNEQTVVASADAEYADIIRDAMREAGLN